jgi:hypothetical protein
MSPACGSCVPGCPGELELTRGAPEHAAGTWRLQFVFFLLLLEAIDPVSARPTTYCREVAIPLTSDELFL